MADVARGDGKDSSACHVIDIATNTQVAEYRGQLPPKEFGFFLVGLASEYNNAMLVVENASIGWATLDAIIERGYRNLYHSPKSDQLTAESYLRAFEGSSDMTPGFTMSLRTRPLVVNKFREYVGDRSVTIRSKRLLEEMKVFVWKNGRPEAQTGYNDDLVMSFGIGMFLRDTSLKFQQLSHDMTRATLGSMKKTTYVAAYGSNQNKNPFQIENPYGGMEDISWIL
jgi:rhamnose utilization protein RhaD (predicted bifunctional aldolase and dehydrogenase)